MSVSPLTRKLNNVIKGCEYKENRYQSPRIHSLLMFWVDAADSFVLFMQHLIVSLYWEMSLDFCWLFKTWHLFGTSMALTREIKHATMLSSSSGLVYRVRCIFYSLYHSTDADEAYRICLTSASAISRLSLPICNYYFRSLRIVSPVIWPVVSAVPRPPAYAPVIWKLREPVTSPQA